MVYHQYCYSSIKQRMVKATVFLRYRSFYCFREKERKGTENERSEVEKMEKVDGIDGGGGSAGWTDGCYAGVG